MSRLTEFYRGEATDARGRSLEDLWSQGDDRMEAVHDFIQWLFPLPEPSRFNPDAPLLTAADVDAFRSDPTLRANLRRSFERFLAFLGLALDGTRVVPAQDFARKQGLWGAPNHNWLRITRVLASTRRLGLEAEARALFDFLATLRRGGPSGITPETFAYWEAAAVGPLD